MLEPEEGPPCLVEIENNYKLTPDWRNLWKKRYGIKSPQKKRKKDKNAPKNPRNAYNYFIKKNHNPRAREHPEKESMEIMRILADEWRKLSSRKRQKYEDMAERDRRRYMKETKEYKKNHPETSESSSGGTPSRSSRKKKKRSSTTTKSTTPRRGRNDDVDYESSTDDAAEAEKVKKKKKSSTGGGGGGGSGGGGGGGGGGVGTEKSSSRIKIVDYDSS